ncbi:N-acetylmuramoyl-L-alanine amidase [Streptomyces canus]|uniref:N-acetylmuramoyl-L-alanine amidase n=1 Tax=Streptomyces canus TaxID=58343 RepID=UPI00224EB5AA|nr:peptidoglycan recognition family protein [Streptomyces canus]MCX4860847.1 N-acetylmuramoyl-L-alanine amidase [Streptomyces canus]
MLSKHRRPRLRLWLGVVSGLATGGLVAGVVATTALGAGGDQAATATASSGRPSHSLQADFKSAAAEFHVPTSVLMAVSYQMTLWESHHGRPSVTGNYNVMALTSVSATDLKPGRDSEAETPGYGDDPRALRHHSAKAGPSTPSETPPSQRVTQAMRTLDIAAPMVNASQASLRTSTRQNIRGAAALLASYERASAGSLPSDAGQWYPAVTRYSQSTRSQVAEQFADRVFATIRVGAHRVTTDNQEVTLPADPSVSAHRSTAVSPDLKPAIRQASFTTGTTATPATECPTTLVCTFTPAAYALNNSTDQSDYGNYDLANRPSDGDAVNTIVIHDTESTAASAINSFQQPSTYASAHYVIGADGSVTQMVPTKDVAWHAGNKYVNDHSIGIEHEGYALDYGTWYTEQEYQSSVALVGYLAQKFDIPLDREHIIGHDDVPGPLSAYYEGMHWDPGPWWNWSHYLTLLGAFPNGNGMPVAGGEVTITPPWSSSYEPTLTGCGSSTTTCPANPANFVYLRTSPSSTAALLTDPKFTADGKPTGTTQGWDWTDKAPFGQTFVVAAVQGDWTAIWYDGQKAWFYNPGGAYTMANTGTARHLITPAGSSAVAVYGRAYPETSAYPNELSDLASQANQQVTPLDHATIQPGQSYTALSAVNGDFYYAEDINCSGTPDCLLVSGNTTYYPIRYNHRLAYVKASDVTVTDPVVPPTGTLKPVTPTRIMDTRNGTGVTKAKVGADGTVTLQVTGKAGVPTSGVTGVIMNVTATNATATSYVTVYPNGSARTSASNLNFPAGKTFPNLVTVPVTNGKVNFYNHAGSVDLIADITGYYTSDGSGSKLTSITPTRLMDTRNGTGVPKAKVGPAGTVSLQVAGKAGLPTSGVTAVVMNVTATRATKSSYVTVYPDGTTRTSASNLNFWANETFPNLVVVPVVNGKLDFYNYAGDVDLIADISGYFTATGSVEHNAGPVRIMDTRDGTGVRKGTVGADTTVTLTVGGHNGVPVDATAVVLNVTAARPTTTSYVTVYPNGVSRPNPASNLNFTEGKTIPNLVVVPVTNGKINFYNNAGNVDLIADLAGYFTG